VTERPRDLPFEALADATSTDWNVGRGELNSALRDIRVQMPDLDDVDLATEILHRALLYRRMYPEIALTPPALAKHWLRVLEEQKRPAAGATNVSAPISECGTCEGHRFVVVSTRPYPQTMWMTMHGRKSRGDVEEWAPCPACAPEISTTYRGADGRMRRSPDPEKVREMMRS
jgi:hypothetical protein